MRLYIDNCCYNLPFDDKSQSRIHSEALAVLDILLRSKVNKDIIIGSKILSMEIDNIKNESLKSEVRTLYNQAIDEKIDLNAEVIEHAKELMQKANIKQMDALHLACALSGNADIFLTVDDRLIKACDKLVLKMRVMNPINMRR